MRRARRRPRVVYVERRGPGCVWTIVGLILIPILLIVLILYTGLLGFFGGLLSLGG